MVNLDGPFVVTKISLCIINGFGLKYLLKICNVYIYDIKWWSAWNLFECRVRFTFCFYIFLLDCQYKVIEYISVIIVLI